MAKATTAPPGKGSKGQPVQPRAEQGNYFAGVIQELRKTTWPTGRELTRMTQIVALTVVMFALLIGGLDLVLSYAVRPLYTQIGTAQPTLSLPAAPVVVPTAKASPATSPAASPATSPAASAAPTAAAPSPATSPAASPAANASPTP